MTSSPPYVAGALVSGAPAHVPDRVLRSPDVRRVLDTLPPWLHAEVDATARAIARAADEYVALPGSLEREGFLAYEAADVPPKAAGELA